MILPELLITIKTEALSSGGWNKPPLSDLTSHISAPFPYIVHALGMVILVY